MLVVNVVTEKKSQDYDASLILRSWLERELCCATLQCE